MSPIKIKENKPDFFEDAGFQVLSMLMNVRYQESAWMIKYLHLYTACLTGDKDPPGIFQGAWKYPGSWNFPGGLEISRT